MTRKQVIVALCAAIVFQILVLIGMIARAAMPLWTGTEVRVKTIPIDPRSVFRGNYARLRYEFGTLPRDALIEMEHRRVGEVVYVNLKMGKGGVYEYAGVSLERPAGGTFLRGRITNGYIPIQVTYGIEAFFAPKDAALTLERDLSDGGTAVLMVSRGGRAALKDVIPAVPSPRVP